MQVKAKQRGYDGQKVREEGEVFEFAGKPGRWMEKPDGTQFDFPKEEVKEKAADPKALKK